MITALGIPCLSFKYRVNVYGEITVHACLPLRLYIILPHYLLIDLSILFPIVRRN